MHFSHGLLSSALLLVPVISAVALPVTEEGSAMLLEGSVMPMGQVAVENETALIMGRAAMPMAQPSADPSFFGVGCGIFNPVCALDLTTYYVAGFSYSVYFQWTSACNMVQYGQTWGLFSYSLWLSTSSINYQSVGAFAQSGLSLSTYAAFNIQTGYYGTSKANWVGFCNDLQKHYKTSRDCTKTQWDAYKSKWSVNENTPCHY